MDDDDDDDDGFSLPLLFYENEMCVVLQQASFLMSQNWQKHYERSTIILRYINLFVHAGSIED